MDDNVHTTSKSVKLDQNQENDAKQDEEKQKSSTIYIDFNSLVKKLTRKMPAHLLVYQRLTLYQSDFDRLDPGQLLNDKIIDFFVEFLVELSKYRESVQQDISKDVKRSNDKILSSYCFASLDQYQYNVDIFDFKAPQIYFRINKQQSILECYDRVFLIVNEADYHWILIEISLSVSTSDLINDQHVVAVEDYHKTNEIQSQNTPYHSTSKMNSTSNKKQKVATNKNKTTNLQHLQNNLSKKQNKQIQSNIQNKMSSKELKEQQNEENVEDQKKSVSSRIKRKIEMRVYNSLGQRQNINNQTAVVLLKKYFQNDFLELYGDQDILEFNVISEKVPTQSGGPDCGVFCCKYLQKLFYENKRQFNYEQFTNAKMVEYRRYIQQIFMDVKNANSEYPSVYDQYLQLSL